MRFALYDIDTGIIRKIIGGSESTAKMNQKPGEVFVKIDGKVSQRTHLIINNRPQLKPDMQLSVSK